MRKLFIVTIMVLTGLSAAGAEEKYLDWVDAADKAIAEEKWDDAEALLIRALKSEPANPSNILLLSNLGMIRFYAGHDSLALATLDDAHRIAPQSVTVLANRARVLTAIGKTAQAIDDYDLIEQIDSTYADTYLYRGLINLYNGRFDEATVDLEKRDSLAPDNEETWVAMASLYSITDLPDKALPYYRRLIDKDPQPEYYAGRAMCYLQKEMLADAAEDIALGIELDLNYSELYVCRALLNKKRYRMDDAVTDAQRAIGLGADRTRVKTLLGI